jgi:hypothetical protein
MRLRSLLLICILLLPSSILAQSKVGQSGAQFLEINVSARAVALGGAFAAVSNDATAIHYNPAGLTQIESKEIALTHIEYVADINYEFVAVAIPIASLGGAAGVAVYALNAGDIPETDYEHSLGYLDRTFNAQEHALAISYARSLTDHFSVGATWKLIEELYAEERAVGWAADIGTTYNTGYRGIKMSMVISNFGPELRFLTDEYPLPISFKFGGTIDLLEGAQHRATLSAEGSHPSDNYESMAVGLEYTYDGKYTLRAGKRVQTDTAYGFAFGGGAVLDVSSYRLSVDYGFLDFGTLKDIHMFTLGFMF